MSPRYCMPTSSCVVFSGLIASKALTEPAGPCRARTAPSSRGSAAHGPGPHTRWPAGSPGPARSAGSRWQRAVAALAGGGIGHHHHVARGGTEVLGRSPVHARAADQAATFGGAPGQFREQADVAEFGVLFPRLVAIRVRVGAAAATVAALLDVQTAGHGQRIGQLERGGDAAAPGGAVHVGGHGHRHGTVRIGPAQRVVVHHMVGVVVVELGLDLSSVAPRLRFSKRSPKLSRLNFEPSMPRPA